MGLHEDFQARQKPEPFWLEEAVYKKILTLSPDNPYALNNLGYLYAEYGVNSQLSQDLCQKAVNLSPDNPGFRDSLGWASFKNRDFITSEQELKKSLAMRSNVYEPNYHIATLYYATGQLEKAEKYYRQALKIKPDSSETLNNLAYLLAEQNKDIDEAKEMSKIAVKLEPGNASYLDTLGWLYYRQGDLDQALHQLIKASHLAPGQGEILMHIGVVKLEQGNFDHAFTYLKEAWKSDPNLKETENALYLALRLKAYYQALEEYHKLLKDKADKNRICNILTSIARLYQEEHQYDKSIEFTKICAEIRNGTRSLAKPVFDFYRIEKKSKETTAVESKEHRDQIPTEDKSEVEDPARTIVEANKEDLEVLPESCGFPLVISLGPDFFKYAGSFVPGLEQFETTSVSFFIKRIFRPSKGIAFRIESENSTGTTLLILARDYFTQLGFKANETNDIDRLDFKIGRKNILAIAENNSLYIFSDLAPSKAKLENLNQICPHRFRTIGSIFYDWKALEARIPGVLKAFVKNPLEPFEKAYSRYSWKNKTLNEFSILSTGKNEDASFMRDFARRLLDLKIQTKKLGIEATIRIRQEKEHFYISIDLEGLKKFFDRYKLPAFLDNAARKLIKNRLDSYSCLISRMFYTSDTVKICPQNGQIRIDSGSGIIECTAHSNLPAIPFFIDDHQACRFYRQRVEAIIKEKYPDGNYFDENLLNDIIKEYNIPQCPTSGNWELGKNGKINCSDHED
jgi:tetratricopeptide (TPR) repeat protein